MKKSRVVANSTSVTAAALLAWAVPTLAQGPGWTVASTVRDIVNTSNGGINVRLTPDLTGCTSQSGYGGAYASIYPNHPGIDRMKADLLVAFTTGAHVELYLGDNTCMVAEMRLSQ
ncbi:MAG TPA: hypothetical protein VFU13_05840 [Steroidobacteraceae bacterium]|nr:hypothetical protein [Steroidobacteraceae bacterium]